MAIDWQLLLAEEGWTPAGVQQTAAGAVALATARFKGVDCARGDLHTTVAAPSLVRTVTDLDRSESWSSVVESEVIGRHGATSDWLQVLDVPGWTLASDRYWLSRGRVEQLGETTVFHWTRVPDGEHTEARARLRAEWPEAVELTVNDGAWRFTPDATGTTIRYAVCSQDPGSLPASVTAYASRRSLPDHLARLVAAAR